MDQTPANDDLNLDILRLMAQPFSAVVEVGCSRGSLAKAYRHSFPGIPYTGIEIDAGYAEVASNYCDRVICGDIENLSRLDTDSLFPSDCWVFGDTLEHLRDPWSVLRTVRQSISPSGQVLACIPNAQHWSVIARLASGFFRYEDQGLLDRTHLRWFTRITMIELFQATGFKVVEMIPRIFDEPTKEPFLAAVVSLAVSAGTDKEIALRDCQPLQYVLKAVPA